MNMPAKIVLTVALWAAVPAPYLLHKWFDRRQR